MFAVGKLLISELNEVHLLVINKWSRFTWFTSGTVITKTLTNYWSHTGLHIDSLSFPQFTTFRCVRSPGHSPFNCLAYIYTELTCVRSLTSSRQFHFWPIHWGFVSANLFRILILLSFQTTRCLNVRKKFNYYLYNDRHSKKIKSN